MPFLDERTLLDPLSPSDMVQRQMEQVDFKPRSAALFYQVAVNHSPLQVPSTQVTEVG